MKGQEAANIVADFVNGAGSREKEEFVKEMMRQHRTLQQESFDLFLKAIESWAEIPEENTDPRNSGAVRLSKSIKAALNKPVDYPVGGIKFTLAGEVKIGTTFLANEELNEWWQFTRIDFVRVEEVDGVQRLVVDGRAKRFYK